MTSEYHTDKVHGFGKGATIFVTEFFTTNLF